MTKFTTIKKKKRKHRRAYSTGVGASFSWSPRRRQHHLPGSGGPILPAGTLYLSSNNWGLETGPWNSCVFVIYMGFPGGSDSKESACDAGDLGLIPGLGRSPGGGHGHPLQYSCLENPMGRGAWRASVHGVTESQTRLND